MMKLQIIQDTLGKTTGIYIPINDWMALKKKFKGLEEIEYKEPTKEQILTELKEAVIELGKIEKGEIKARSAKEFLNEL